MPADDEATEPAAGAQPSARPRKRLLISLAAVVVAAAVFGLALVFAPEPMPTAAPQPQPQPAPAAAPAPQPSQPPAGGGNATVPAEQGPRFEGWVDEVAQWLDIPSRAMRGYALATVTLDKEQPNCQLSWVTLAAIGKVTTNHGRANGGAIGPDGRMTAPLGTVELRDFYGAVVSAPNAKGPMQLPPSLWQQWQRSAAGGEPDPQHIDDAALSAGRALCAHGRNLANGTDWWNAVASVQKAPLFLHRVLATANVYGTVGQREAPPHPAVLRAVTFAIDKIGLPYVWGGNGAEASGGFDCSGLTVAAYGESGITIRRTADWQYRDLKIAPRDAEPRLGDLIFFGDPRGEIHHVGLYIGNQQMIDAPTFGQAVQVHPYRTPGDDYAGSGSVVTG